MKQKKVILFDLDGTLLNTSLDLQTALYSVQQHFGLALSSLESVEESMGHGIKALVKRNILDSIDLDEALQLFEQSYAKGYMHQTVAYPGVLEGLKKLKDLGYHLGVVSNKEDVYAQTLIQKHFEGIFDFVLGAKDNVPKKPHPHMLTQALAFFDCSKDEAIYVGDTEVDLDSAQAVDMDALLVSYGYRSFEDLKSLNVEIAQSVLDCFETLSCV
jgi:phosphoglycolate phosphatase